MGFGRSPERAESEAGGSGAGPQSNSPEGRRRPKRFVAGIANLLRPPTFRSTASTDSSVTLRGSPEPGLPEETPLPISPTPTLLLSRPVKTPTKEVAAPSVASSSNQPAASTDQAATGPIELCSGLPNPTVDIFFVHGLNGSAFKTWQKKDVLWPKHLLGPAFPNARIFTYGYDADVVKLFSRVGKGTIFQHSRSLIQAVHRVRRDHYQRPIIFVAHSLGGILVKDGLSWAKAQTGFSAIKVNEVYSATKGVIFLGTPHRGASGQYAEVGEQLRRLVGLFLQDSNSHLLSSLKSDSETLPRISEDFHRLCEDKRFLIFSFVETLPITNVKGIGGLVVDASSGYMGLSREERDVIPRANHMEMVRFLDKNDEGYQKIEDAIHHCIDAATRDSADGELAGVPEGPNNTGSYELIYEFTANSQHLTDIQILRTGRLEGTCEWIADQISFQNWISGTTKLLLLVGAAGAGKSHVLAKAVDLLDQRFEKPRRGDTSTALTAYFFCRTPNKKKTLVNGVKSLIGQLAYLDEAYADELSVLWDRHRAYDENSSPSISWLWQNLLATSRALAKRTCIFLVVDGLDECDALERREFLDSAYTHCAGSSGPVIQVFCSGRPEVKTDMTQIMDSHISSSLDVPMIEISWQTKNDIEMLVGKKMARVKFSRDKHLRSKVQEAIVSDANGMFLWTDLTLKEFMNARSNLEVESCLERMKATPNLDAMYQGIMDSLINDADEVQVQIFKSITTWLIHGTDVMHYNLLEEAIERTVGTKIFALSEEIERFGSVIEIGGFQRLRLASTALEQTSSTDPWAARNKDNFSAGFDSDSSDDGEDDDIWQDDGTGITGDEIVRIRHATFQKWYFDGLDQKSPIWLSSTDAHIELSQICLDTLLQFDKSAKRYPKLLDYARDAWCEHLHKINWTDAPKERVIDISSKLHALFTDWPATRSWLRDASFLKWMEMRSALETSLRALLLQTADFEDAPPSLRTWTREISGSTSGPLQALSETLINTANLAGYFRDFPGIEGGNVDFHLVMRALLFFYEIAAATYPIDASMFLNTSYEKFRSQFWHHDVWKGHGATKEYALAELADDDDFEVAIAGYLDANRNRPNEPVVTYQLAALHLRQNWHLDALIYAEVTSKLCSTKGDNGGLSHSRLLEARIHDATGELPEAFAKYREAVALGNARAVDLLASHYAGMDDSTGRSEWFNVYAGYAATEHKTLEDTFAEAILRQPVFAEWHSTFTAVARELKHEGLLIKSYKRATRLAKNKGEHILTQCGCRFHLAMAHSGPHSRRSKAIPLWTWILNNLTRFKSECEGSGDNEIHNRLFTLTIEELSVSQVLTLNHPLVYFAENVDLAVFDYARILIMLGKGIERQPHLGDDAAKLYRRVLRRAVQMARQTALLNHQIRTVLGDTLLALGDHKDAARALSWACMYKDPPKWEAAAIAARGGADGPPGAMAAADRTGQQQLHTRISWHTLCDMCMAKRSWSTSMEIFGYRYKCCACGELDLCEPCYVAWTTSSRSKGSGSSGRDDKAHQEGGNGQEHGGVMRHCSSRHEFLKLPASDHWPEVEAESRLIQENGMPKSVLGWLDELVAKFDLQVQR